MSHVSAGADPAPPELLSPAGNWECARAAVANGADAIYFGLQAFNARLRAENFTDADLPELMVFLHRHGVRGFVAMNTLIFTSELEAAEAQLKRLEAARVDAIIVQDPGLALLARRVAPGLEIHASTQMTITSPEGLAFAGGELGVDRAVLAREVSLRELGRFRADAASAVPLEVFVHGALCVAYSGQCLTSEALGRRSANRGECAQACRLPYQLVVDGETRDLGDRRYLLSPQDLAAIDEVPELIRLGVRSFKIEGRLKTPEYVAAVTRAYRAAIDRARGVAVLATTRSVVAPSAVSAASRIGVTSDDVESTGRQDGDPTGGIDRQDGDPTYALEMVFSRGLSTGWLHGVNHQQLVHARYGKKRGALIGTVTRSGPGFVEARLDGPVAAGDGVVFENPADTDHEMGGRVLTVDGTRLEFDRRANVDPRRVAPGTRIFKTDDPRLDAELRRTWARIGAAPGRIALRLRLTGCAGGPLRVEATAVPPDGVPATLATESTIALATAKTKPLTEEVAREQFARLGGTPLHLEALEFAVGAGLMLPLSELNRMRREIVERIQGSGFRRGAGTTLASHASSASDPRPPSIPRGPSGPPSLSVLCRSIEQIEVALDLGCARIYVDFEDIRRCVDAVVLVRQRGAATGSASRVLIATPRIQKAGEEGFFKVIERAEPDGVLVRNLGAIRYFAARPHFERVGDFSLNVANPLSAGFFIARGLGRLTLSYDLNIMQVLDLLRAAPPEWFELTLHQHMPMFHMEHCVFAAFMSNGTDSTNCGRPCEKHRVELRDRVGQLHPLLADVGCRNTLFRGQAQSGARFFHDLRAARLRRFRIELLREDAVDARRVIGAYQRLVAGMEDGETLWRNLHATSQLGVTEGTLRE